jgi:hypothetical protein
MTAHFPGLVEAFIIKGGGAKLMNIANPFVSYNKSSDMECAITSVKQIS